MIFLEYGNRRIPQARLAPESKGRCKATGTTADHSDINVLNGKRGRCEKEDGSSWLTPICLMRSLARARRSESVQDDVLEKFTHYLDRV